VGQIGFGVGDFVNVKEPRVRDMGRVIFRLGVAVGRRQIPRCVDDTQIGIVEMLCQPVGGDEGFRVAMGHVVVPVGCDETDLSLQAD
jgi:hypothetical protein